MNTEHEVLTQIDKPIFEPSAFLRWPSPDEVPGIIDQLTRLLVDEFDPLQVILFGSYARGDANEASDIDLLVVVPDEIEGTRHELGCRGQARLWDIPMPVDSLVRRPSSVKKGREIPNAFERTIYTQGKILYERPGLTPDLRLDILKPSLSSGEGGDHALSQGITSHSLNFSQTWIKNAAKSLEASQLLINDPDILLPAIFYCHLCAEKSIKALLLLNNFPSDARDFRTNDLSCLLRSVSYFYPELGNFAALMENLNKLAMLYIDPTLDDSVQLTMTDFEGAFQCAESLLHKASLLIESARAENPSLAGQDIP